MRSIYITYGNTAKMMDVGYDLLFEVTPGDWRKADKVSADLLHQEQEMGTLKAGIPFDGRVYDKFNVNDPEDQRILRKNGINISGDAQRQDGDNGLEEVFKNMKKIEAMLRLQNQVDLEALNARADRAGKELEELSKDSQGEGSGTTQMNFLDELARSLKGMSREANNLEALFKIQAAVDFTTLEPGNELLGDASKIERLRRIFMELA